MVFIEKYFGKKPVEVTESDIEAFVRKNLEESATLEYKDIRKLTEGGDLSKVISAFANTLGGLLILGIEKSDVAPHLPGKITWGDSSYKKERLENTIMDNIHPRIEPPLIVPIRNRNDEQIFLVEVKPSVSPPHQASDFKYYKRWNFSSVPMRHQEVMSYSELEDSFEEARNLAKGVFTVVLAGILYFLAWPSLYLSSSFLSAYLSPDSGPVEVMVGVLVILTLYSTLWRLTFERIVVGWRRFSAWAFLAIWCLAAGGLVITAIGSWGYPVFFRDEVMLYWNVFDSRALISAISITILLAAQEKALPHYFRQMHDDDPLGKLKINVESPFFNGFTQLKALVANKKVAAVVLTATLIVPGAIGGGDLGLHGFTPGVRATVVPNTLRLVFNGYYNATYLMFIMSTATFAYRNSSQPSDCNASYFQPFNETLRIHVPSIQPPYSINNITVANPSSISVYTPLSYGSTHYYYNPYSISSWQTLGIINSNHTWISVLPKDKPAQELEIGFANQSRGSDLTIGLRYFQLAHPMVSCTEADHYYRQSNSTLIVHQFEIVNNGPSAIGMDSVVARDFQGLNIYPRNVTITINGRLVGINSLSYNGYPNSDYGLWDYPIMPHTNVTLVVEGNSTVL